MTVDELRLYQEFRPVGKDSAAAFRPFQGKCVFGDTTFTLFYIWQDRFHYAYRFIGDTLVVLEYGINDHLTCILLPGGGTDIAPIISELFGLFQHSGLPLYLGYVSEDGLPAYIQAALQLRRELIIHSTFDDSDYIYDTESFLALTGGRNKGKRGDLNALLREFPGIHMVSHDEASRDLRQVCTGLFDQWCSVRDCRDCFYGCEKKAFLRFWDIYDPARHHVGVGYADGYPVSFAISEEINPEMDCYYFQKNALRTRGLTYWLNREMALERTHIKYINLGEDMGLPGLRTDKTGLHPTGFGTKFTVKIQ